ncbi:cupin domain-containing protein [Azotobacter armeniacus]
MPSRHNLFQPLPDASAGECFDDLLSLPGCRLERIVSQGQASPPGFWYDQDWDEWVLLLAGSAVLRLASEPQPIALGVGDHLLIPAGERHRVEATDPAGPTVWLAVHVPGATSAG